MSKTATVIARIDDDLNQRINRGCKVQGIIKSEWLRRALENYANRQQKLGLIPAKDRVHDV